MEAGGTGREGMWTVHCGCCVSDCGMWTVDISSGIAEEAILSIFGDYRGLVYRSSEEQVEISA